MRVFCGYMRFLQSLKNRMRVGAVERVTGVLKEKTVLDEVEGGYFEGA